MKNLVFASALRLGMIAEMSASGVLSAQGMPGALPASPIHMVQPDAAQSSRVEAAFGPKPTDAALRLIEKVIDSARSSVVVAAYQMSSKPVADVLIRAAARGVKVYVIADKASNQPSNGRSRIVDLAQAGTFVRMNGMYPEMRNKFIVVDGVSVETGSYNYSYSGQRRNAENVVVIWNNPEIGRQFPERLLGPWNESEQLPAIPASGGR